MTVCALSDESLLRVGVRSIGMRAGSTSRVSGSSIAAPQIARWIATAMAQAIDAGTDPAAACDSNAMFEAAETLCDVPKIRQGLGPSPCPPVATTRHGAGPPPPLYPERHRKNLPAFPPVSRSFPAGITLRVHSGLAPPSESEARQEDGKMPDEKKVRILALELSLKVFLGGLATAVLVAVEYQKLTMLNMPVSAALVSFDAVIATISNAGSAIIMASIILLLFILACFLIAAAFLAAAALRLVLVAFVASTPAGFMSLLRFILTFRTSARLLLVRSGTENETPATLRKRFADKFPRLGSAESKASGFSQTTLEKQFQGLARSWETARNRFCGFCRIFLTARDTSPRAQGLRWGLLFVVLFCVFFFSRVAVHHQERQMFFEASMPEACCAARPVVDKVARQLEGWLNSAVGRVIVTPFESGSVIYDRPEIAEASHLRPFRSYGDDQRAVANGLRRELIFYIGDFGDWAYLARFRNPHHRLMVRKSKVVEFARYDPDDYTPPVVVANGSTAADPTPTQIRLSPKIDLGNRLAMNLRVSIWGNRLSTEDPQEATAQFDRLSARVELLETGLARVGRLRAQSDWLAVAQARLADRLVTLAERQGEDAGKLDRLSRHDSSIQTLDDRADRNDVDLVKLATRLDSQEAGLVNLQKAIEALPQTEGDPETLITALKAAMAETLPDQIGTAIRDNIADVLPGEIRLAIQDGLSTRPTGMLNDLQRRFGANYVDTCTNATTSPQWHVAFGEGKAASDDRETLAAIASHLRRQSEQGAGHFVVLRGGASFTGQPESNIHLSEARAEWVKTDLLRRLVGPGGSADLADRARDTMDLQIAAIGLGERMGSPVKGVSPRDVEVFLCNPTTGQPLSAEEHLAAKE